MITAIFKKKCGNIISFNIKGHADSVEDGYDLVCCAVSAISITIANGITEIAKVNSSIHMDDGFLSLSLESNSLEHINKCQMLMETMVLGLKSIERDNSKYINVIIEEVE